MELTQVEQDLINGLVIFGVEEQAVIGILSGLKTEQQQEQMIDYLIANEGASQSDILSESSISTAMQA